MQPCTSLLIKKPYPEKRYLRPVAPFYSGNSSAADTVEYDSSFLMGTGASTIDVKRYAQGNPTPPGLYNVRVFVNGQPTSSLEIPFVDIGENSAAACITHKTRHNFTLSNLNSLSLYSPEKVRKRIVWIWQSHTKRRMCALTVVTSFSI